MSELIKELKRNRVVSLKEAIELAGSKTTVYRFEERGEIVKIHPQGLGYFTLPEIEEGEAQFAVIAKYYPECVVSGKTAMSLYGLSLDYIREIDVDIPRETNLSNGLVKVHRVVAKKINNIIKRSFKERGVPFDIKIYSAERTLHEAYKYYKGLDAFYFAIKQYRKLYLNKKNQGELYNTILSIDKKVGQEILNYLAMDDVNE